MLDHPVIPLASAWGARDPRESGVTGLWFYHVGRLVSWIIETGRPGFIGGMGLIERKLDLGFEKVPQWSVLRPLAPGTLAPRTLAPRTPAPHASARPPAGTVTGA